MLTFTNPQHTAEDAAEAMRNLVFATRSFADPSDTYWVVSDLAATARRMEQVVIQVASAHRENIQLAHDHTGSPAVGGVKALTAAAHLRRVADLLGRAHTSLDLAANHSSGIAWYDAASAALTAPATEAWRAAPRCSGSPARPNRAGR